MELGKVSLVDAVTLLIALVSLLVAMRALSRTKSNELFALRQSLVIKSEQARSAWYDFVRENESLIKQAHARFPSHLSEAKMLFEFLLEQRDHLKMCLKDVSALADDIHANVDKFSEKKCRRYLRDIDPSLEILSRNRGVSGRKFDELLQRIETASVQSPQS